MSRKMGRPVGTSSLISLVMMVIHGKSEATKDKEKSWGPPCLLQLLQVGCLYCKKLDPKVSLRHRSLPLSRLTLDAASRSTALPSTKKCQPSPIPPCQSRFDLLNARQAGFELFGKGPGVFHLPLGYAYWFSETGKRIFDNTLPAHNGSPIFKAFNPRALYPMVKTFLKTLDLKDPLLSPPLPQIYSLPLDAIPIYGIIIPI